MYLVTTQPGFFELRRRAAEVDEKIDLDLETYETVETGDTAMSVSVAIYPEIANPVKVARIVFHYDDTRLELTGGQLRGQGAGGLPSANQFVIHNVANFTGGSFIQPEEGDICAEAGNICFTLAYVAGAQFTVTSDEQSGILADLNFRPIGGGNFASLDGQILSFDFLPDEVSLGADEAYEEWNLNNLSVVVGGEGCTQDCEGKACGADDGCGGTCQTGYCDTGYVCVNGACQPEAVCTNGEIRVCSTGLPGICSAGIETCAAGQWGNCVPDYEIGEVDEICDNNLDDNCDGEIDEDCKAVTECDPGATEACTVSGVQGVCATGRRVCSTEGDWGVCEQTVQPSDEICDDGLDNDCDGSVDASDSDCPTEEACVPTTEVCDGIDNDCDDQIDEGLTRACGIDTGACSTGTQICTAGVWGECTGGVTPVQEICDDIDNDCDGETDEDFNLNTDENYCGSCTIACDTDEVCVSGDCVLAGEVDCQNDSDCAGSQVCSNGVCVIIACFDDEDCDDEQACTLETCSNSGTISSSCIYTSVAADCGARECGLSPNGCGTCGICLDSQSCSSGVCTDIVCTIDADCDDEDPCTADTCSNSVCSHVDVQTDCGARVCGDAPNACGNCGSCETGELCDNGSCISIRGATSVTGPGSNVVDLYRGGVRDTGALPVSGIFDNLVILRTFAVSGFLIFSAFTVRYFVRKKR